jgi:chromosomal replication initiation ATPase DnaA
MNLIRKIKENKPIYQNDIAVISLPMSINSIKSKVCSELGINELALSGRSRHPDLVMGRFTVAVLGKRHSKISHELIGYSIGRDHSTITHYLNKARIDMPYNRKLKNFVKQIESML